jgi:hypothetical protein
MYVQGVEGPDGRRQYFSHVEIGKKLNISTQTVNRRSQETNWLEQRKAFTVQVQMETDAKRRTELANQAVEFDSVSLQLARAIEGEIGRLIQSANRDRQKADALVAEQRAWDAAHPNERRPVLEKEFKPFTPFALGSMAAALATVQRVGRLAVGESTENTSVKHSLSATEEIQAARNFIDGVIEQRQSGRAGSVGKLH